MTDRIAVLAGGTSCEREISLISGLCVFDALSAKGFSAVMFDPSTQTPPMSGVFAQDSAPRADNQGRPAGRHPVKGFMEQIQEQAIRLVFIALHGSFGEDGTVQKMLDEKGIIYTGSGARASEVAFDKPRTQALLSEAGIRVPAFVSFRKEELFPPVLVPFEYPLVVKPSKAGSSVGIRIVQNEADYLEAAAEAFRWSDSLIVEKYIHGRELTVGILADKPLPIVEIISTRPFYDYEAKYKDAATRYECPAKLEQGQESEIRDMALRAYQTIGCQVMARVDVLLSDESVPYILEINTIPGLTNKSLLPKAAKAVGIDFPDLCVRILELSTQKKSPRVFNKKKEPASWQNH